MSVSFLFSKKESIIVIIIITTTIIVTIIIITIYYYYYYFNLFLLLFSGLSCCLSSFLSAILSVSVFHFLVSPSESVCVTICFFLCLHISLCLYVRLSLSVCFFVSLPHSVCLSVCLSAYCLSVVSYLPVLGLHRLLHRGVRWVHRVPAEGPLAASPPMTTTHEEQMNQHSKHLR